MSAEGDDANVSSPNDSNPSDSSEPPFWRNKKPSSRPWTDKPRRKKTVPPEQSEGFSRARRSVAKAARSILGTTVSVAHEALVLSVDPLRLAPVPGLAEAAGVLLAIWDALEQIQTNRMACVSLVERCADILFAVREEVEAAGGHVTKTLKDPVEKLTYALKQVEETMRKLWDKPFLKRYLQRDADLRRISGCNQVLTDAVSLFGLAVQIRTLKQLKDSEAARRHDMTLFRPNVPTEPVGYPAAPPAYDNFTLTPRARSLSGPSLAPKVTVKEVSDAIARLQSNHATIDEQLDEEDLKAILRTALHEPDDVAIIRMLEIDRLEWPEAIKTLQRTLEDLRYRDPRAPRSADVKGQDTIHREFIESGIDTLRRMSGDGDMSVPSWTITKYEVDPDVLIGMGSYASVYRGTYKRTIVAIKILSATTPKDLFVHEMKIWSSLSHPHVLSILGASSATSEPPWFFVSPYMKNGSLVSYLKKRPALANPISFIYQIAVGMEYLHSQGVLHGDLKAVNVLIDDKLKCVISDFGQSKLKNEVYRLTGVTDENVGTTRWKAPELLSGKSSLTQEIDIYAFAITCIEILTFGDLPWADIDDSVVRTLVLKENRRPEIPFTPWTSLPLIALIKAAWDVNPAVRPSFPQIARETEILRSGVGPHEQDLTPPQMPIGLPGWHTHAPSPPILPTQSPNSVPNLALDRQSSTEPTGTSTPKLRDGSPLRGLGLSGVATEPNISGEPTPSEPSSGSHSATIETEATRASSSAPGRLDDYFQIDPASTPKAGLLDLAPDEGLSYSVEVHRPNSSRPSSIISSSESTHETIEWDGYDSPPPMDDIIALRRDERRYRLLLSHNFYSSLKLPLWSPSSIRVGSLGYLSKPSGQFVTLFNAFETASDVPHRNDSLPSLHGYGHVNQQSIRKDTRSAGERAFEGIRGLLPLAILRRTEGSTTRRASFPLRSGHKYAYMYTETTTYRYMDNLLTPKKWLKANIDGILRIYGPEHRLQKEDVLLGREVLAETDNIFIQQTIVIGTLDAPDYAIFVSHRTHDGQLHFDSFDDRRNGRKWGEFKLDRSLPQGSTIGGPSWADEQEGSPHDEVYSTKVSINGESVKGWDSLILARLRFRPDEDDPTSQ